MSTKVLKYSRLVNADFLNVAGSLNSLFGRRSYITKIIKYVVLYFADRVFRIWSVRKIYAARVFI